MYFCPILHLHKAYWNTHLLITFKQTLKIFAINFVFTDVQVATAIPIQS